MATQRYRRLEESLDGHFDRFEESDGSAMISDAVDLLASVFEGAGLEEAMWSEKPKRRYSLMVTQDQDDLADLPNEDIDFNGAHVRITIDVPSLSKFKAVVAKVARFTNCSKLVVFIEEDLHESINRREPDVAATKILNTLAAAGIQVPYVPIVVMINNAWGNSFVPFMMNVKPDRNMKEVEVWIGFDDFKVKERFAYDREDLNRKGWDFQRRYKEGEDKIRFKRI
jgi:hypothetical protein